MQWSSEYETGNELIDSQHRLLVLLCRKVELAYSGGLERKVIVGLCQELRKFVDFHFVSEENVMREVDYPDHYHHANAHRHLVSDLDNLIRKVNEGSGTPASLLKMMSEWLLGHIRGDDARLADYIRSSGNRALGESEYGLYLR
jgi:hemerythrin-like metal-binding protein